MRVIDCMRGSSANGSPTGHVATSSSAAATIARVVLGDPRAVERRQHQLALAQVLVAVEHEQRVRAEDAAEEAVDVAHVHVLGRAVEDAR